MIDSMAFFVAIVAIIAAAALIMMERLAQKAGHSVSASSATRGRGRDIPSRAQGAYEPAYCYNDCMRSHEDDPSFPCEVACGITDGRRI